MYIDVVERRFVWGRIARSDDEGMTRADAIAALLIAVAMLGFLVSWWFSRLPDERPDTLSNKMRDTSRFVWLWLAAALWVAIFSVWWLLD